MNFRTTSIFLALAILLGLAFESFKDASEPTLRQDQEDHKVELFKAKFDFANLTQSTHRPAIATAKPASPAEPDTVTVEAQVVPGTQKLADAKDAAKKDAKKKKKKKKKGEDNTATDIAKTEPAAAPPTSSGLRFGSGGTGVLAPKQQPPVDSVKDTIEEWIAYFLESPNDYQRFLEFITAYQTQEITQEVFYGVVEELAVQPSQMLQRFAVLALVSTPSAESFRELVALQNSNNPSLSSQANAALSDYQVPDRLTILASLLNNNEDQRVVVESMSRIRQIVSRYVASNTSRSGRDLRNHEDDSPGAGVATRLRQLRALLTSLTRNLSVTSTIRSEASSILGLFPTPPTSPRVAAPSTSPSAAEPS
jgi:hypothetical protein